MTGPFVINTRDLPRRAGSMRELHRTVTLEEPLGSEVIAVPGGAAIELDLRLESVSEGVLVTGTVSGVAVGECVRCLPAIPGRSHRARLPLRAPVCCSLGGPGNTDAVDCKSMGIARAAVPTRERLDTLPSHTQPDTPGCLQRVYQPPPPFPHSSLSSYSYTQRQL